MLYNLWCATRLLWRALFHPNQQVYYVRHKDGNRYLGSR